MADGAKTPKQVDPVTEKEDTSSAKKPAAKKTTAIEGGNETKAASAKKPTAKKSTAAEGGNETKAVSAKKPAAKKPTAAEGENETKTVPAKKTTAKKSTAAEGENETKTVPAKKPAAKKPTAAEGENEAKTVPAKKPAAKKSTVVEGENKAKTASAKKPAAKKSTAAEDAAGTVVPIREESTASHQSTVAMVHLPDPIPDGEKKGSATEPEQTVSENESEKKSALPLEADGRELQTAIPPVNFPEEITRRSILRRIGLFFAIAAVFLLAVWIFFFRPAGYTERIVSMLPWYDTANEQTCILVDGSEIGRVSGQLTWFDTDGRGEVGAALTETGELWLIQGSKMRLIASDVADAVLSVGGKALAFRTEDNALYRCTSGKKDQPQLVARDVAEEPFCLSPNGKELLYLSNMEGTRKMEIASADGKAPYLTNTTDYLPIAVSDGCRYLYFCNEEHRLFIYDSKTARMTDCGNFRVGSLVFNRDMRELVFEDGQRSRFYRNGTLLNPVGLTEGEALELLPNRRVATAETLYGRQYLQKTLFRNYYAYLSNEAVMLSYVKRHGEELRITNIHFTDSAATVTVTDEYVYFISTDVTATDARSNLYAVPGGKATCQRLMSDVVEYCTNTNGNRILYRDAHGPLRAMRIGSAPQQLADGAAGGSLLVSLDDVFYYLGENGELYRSENGATPEQMAAGVTDVWTDAHVCIYRVRTTDGAEYYTNYRNRRKSNLVFTEIVPPQG